MCLFLKVLDDLLFLNIGMFYFVVICLINFVDKLYVMNIICDIDDGVL